MSESAPVPAAAFPAGHLADEEGVTVEAEGVFILPRWARERSNSG